MRRRRLFFLGSCTRTVSHGLIAIGPEVVLSNDDFKGEIIHGGVVHQVPEQVSAKKVRCCYCLAYRMDIAIRWAIPDP